LEVNFDLHKVEEEYIYFHLEIPAIHMWDYKKHKTARKEISAGRVPSCPLK